MRRSSLWLTTVATAGLLVGIQSVMAQPGPGGGQGDRPRGRGRPPRARRIPRVRDALKVGEKAPDFELKTVDGKNTVRLSSFRGKRPVLLIFGSYT